MTILNEVEYQHRTRLWADIKQYVGKGYYIHFGETEKLGVKVKGKFHGDPVGLYFYNLDWLVQTKRFASGQQFAVYYPFWTIIEKRADDRGVIFSRLNFDEVDTIAAKNDWPGWEKFKERHAAQSYNNAPPHNTPAALFWDYIKLCGQNAQAGVGLTQNGALRGISFVEDNGMGLIHPSEPNQLIVFDPRVMRVVARGNQGQRHIDDRTAPAHKFAFNELLKKLRGEYGGEIVWKYKYPKLSFTKKGATFNLELKIDTFGGLFMEALWGRARKTFHYKESDFYHATMDEVVGFFTGIVEKISALSAAKKDLFFTPILSEKDAMRDIKSIIDDSFKFRTEIENDSKNMIVYAEKDLKVGKSDMSVMVYCQSRPDEAKYYVNIKMGSYPVTSARAYSVEELAPQLEKHFAQMLEGLAPVSGEYRGRFYDEEEYKAFIGLIADYSGVRHMKERYAQEIEYWNNYKNKDSVYTDIKRIF